MKKLILSSIAFIIFGLTAFSQDLAYLRNWYVNEYVPRPSLQQDLRFEVRGAYTCPVNKVKLNEATLLSDISPGYPANWVKNYISTEIVITSNGKEMKAAGKNAFLSNEQKSILKTADLNTDIVIDVRYNYKNSATDEKENGRVNYSVTVIPEIEAEFPGGTQQLAKYLKENALNRISKTTPIAFQQGMMKFTVNEAGEIENVQIINATGDAKTDQMLLDAFYKMPKWKPAEISTGLKVKQKFVFSFGSGGC